jgi:hypothetical protein
MRALQILLAAVALGLPSLAAAQRDCPLPQSLVAQRSLNNTCYCEAGWYGPDCNVCTSNKGCMLLDEDEFNTCSRDSYVAVRQNHGFCEVKCRDAYSLWDGLLPLWHSLPCSLSCNSISSMVVRHGHKRLLRLPQ